MQQYILAKREVCSRFLLLAGRGLSLLATGAAAAAAVPAAAASAAAAAAADHPAAHGFAAAAAAVVVVAVVAAAAAVPFYGAQPELPSEAHQESPGSTASATAPGQQAAAP